MAKWKVVVTDTTEYEIEADTRAQAEDIAYDWWQGRDPEIKAELILPDYGVKIGNAHFDSSVEHILCNCPNARKVDVQQIEACRKYCPLAELCDKFGEVHS